jgi:hypothetical protein
VNTHLRYLFIRVLVVALPSLASAQSSGNLGPVTRHISAQTPVLGPSRVQARTSRSGVPGTTPALTAWCTPSSTRAGGRITRVLNPT